MGRKRSEGTDGMVDATEPRQFGGVKGTLTEEEKAARLANRRSYLLMFQAHETARPELVKEFANRQQLRKWWTVGVDANPALNGHCFVVRGKLMGLESIISEPTE